MSAWVDMRLGDLGEIVTGRTPSKNNPQDWGDVIPFVTPTDYGQYLKKAKNAARMLSRKGMERLSGKVLPENSVMVTCIGSDMGKVAINAVPVVTNQQINSIVPDPTAISSDFLYYILKNSYEILKSYGRSGTAVPIVNKGDFSSITVQIPQLPEQRAIAEVLSSLDDKIDLLHRQNETLEALAETLFRQWFINQTDEGWEEGTLGEAIELFDKKRVPLSKMQRDKMKEGKLYPYYGAASIMDYVNDYLFDGEYILLGEDGTVQTDEGYPILQYATGQFWVNNHAHILQAKEPYNNFFIWCYLSQRQISNIVTGAVQPKISQANLKALSMPRYPEERIERFKGATSEIFYKVNGNKEQIKTLEQLRDTLLPKLISGEARVAYKDNQQASEVA